MNIKTIPRDSSLVAKDNNTKIRLPDAYLYQVAHGEGRGTKIGYRSGISTAAFVVLANADFSKHRHKNSCTCSLICTLNTLLKHEQSRVSNRSHHQDNGCDNLN